MSSDWSDTMVWFGQILLLLYFYHPIYMIIDHNLPCVLNSSESESVHLLVQSHQGNSDGQSLLSSVAHRLPRRHHHLARPALVTLAVLLQEPAQTILLPSQEADPVLVYLHQPLQSTCCFVDGPSKRNNKTRCQMTGQR